MPLDIEYIPSPNQSSRRGADVVATVIHFTAGASAFGSIRWFQMPESATSAHYVIGRDGDVTRMVKLSRTAWHAGRSEIAYNGSIVHDVNRYSIGIELANHGPLIARGDGFFWELGRREIPYSGAEPRRATLRWDNGHEMTAWWEPYPDAQIDALQELLHKLSMMGYSEAARNPVGHEEIALPYSQRKCDPGPLFPWGRLSRRSSRRTSSVLLND